MVLMVWLYVQRFGTESGKAPAEKKEKKEKKSKAGMLEGLYLFWEFTFVKGITACSCIFMIQVTILDYAMKVLAKGRSRTRTPAIRSRRPRPSPRSWASSA